MKLHIKLMLSLLGSVAVVITLAQVWQYHTAKASAVKQAQDTLAVLTEREKENATNVYLSVQNSVAGSLERGEMEKFTRLLEQQQEVKGLLEFSLFDKNGVVTHSSEQKYVGQHLDKAIEQQLAGHFEHQTMISDEAIEVYKPQLITEDCRRCHTSWDVGGVGGYTYFRFSAETLVNAKKQATESIAFAQQSALFNGVMTTVGVMAVIMIATFLVVRKLVGRPLNLIISMLEQFEADEGDLTYRLPVTSNDEIGKLAELFNVFIGKMHNVMCSVATSTRQVVSGASDIAASSEQMAAGMQMQSQQISEISSSVEQMSDSVADVAKKAAEASDSAIQSGDVAKEGGETVRLTIEGMQGIEQSVSESATSVEQLGERGQEIVKVIEMINEIAEQTNLLALNAAIEAARAGEAGKGFAVVADEVRKLADRTTQSTKTIAESINAMREETDQAVERMQEGTQQVQAGVHQAEDAGNSLEKIVSHAHEVAGMVQSIAAATEEQSSASDQITQNVESILAMSNQTNEGAASAAQAAAALSTNAENLKELIGQFKLEAEEEAAA